MRNLLASVLVLLSSGCATTYGWSVTSAGCYSKGLQEPIYLRQLRRSQKSQPRRSLSTLRLMSTFPTRLLTSSARSGCSRSPTSSAEVLMATAIVGVPSISASTANKGNTAAGGATYPLFQRPLTSASLPVAATTGTVRSLSNGETMRAPMATRRCTTSRSDLRP